MDFSETMALVKVPPVPATDSKGLDIEKHGSHSSVTKDAIGEQAVHTNLLAHRSTPPM